VKRDDQKVTSKKGYYEWWRGGKREGKRRRNEAIKKLRHGQPRRKRMKKSKSTRGRIQRFFNEGSGKPEDGAFPKGQYAYNLLKR